MVKAAKQAAVAATASTFSAVSGEWLQKKMIGGHKADTTIKRARALLETFKASIGNRIDSFRDALREAINETIVDRKANCVEAAHRGLRRIAETLDLVPDAMLHYLAMIDDATDGVVMAAVEVSLLAVGSGVAFDYADAATFLASFDPIIALARKRMMN